MLVLCLVLDLNFEPILFCLSRTHTYKSVIVMRFLMVGECFLLTAQISPFYEHFECFCLYCVRKKYVSISICYSLLHISLLSPLSVCHYNLIFVILYELSTLLNCVLRVLCGYGYILIISLRIFSFFLGITHCWHTFCTLKCVICSLKYARIQTHVWVISFLFMVH